VVIGVSFGRHISRPFFPRNRKRIRMISNDFRFVVVKNFPNDNEDFVECVPFLFVFGFGFESTFY